MGPEEQRMKMVVYAVVTLFFAVPAERAKFCDSRNGLRVTELRRIIRRSQSEISELTLLFTLLSAYS